MRVYLSGGLSKILDDSNLIKHSTNYKEIYSPDGMFRIQNDKMIQLIPEDKKIENFSLDGRRFLVDKGGMIQKKNVQTLPYEHIVVEIERIEYKLTNKSLVSLNVLHNKNKIVDMYFFIKTDTVCTNTKNDIREYLTLLDTNKGIPL
jgi:hypothetical protein